ncbi:MAG: hypothetical protein ACRDRJ_10170 [Streptosporangiaceae bacterium]
MRGLVRAESSAEQAAREHAQLLERQNWLLEEAARRGHRQAHRQEMACCEACRELRCDQAMPADVITRVQTALICDCPDHHQTAPGW